MAAPAGQVTDESRYTALFDPKELAASNKNASVTSSNWTTVLRVDFRWLRSATVVAYNSHGAASVNIRIIGSLEDATVPIEVPGREVATEPDYPSTAGSWIDSPTSCVIADEATILPATHGLPLQVHGNYAWCLVQAQKDSEDSTVSVWFRGKS